MLFLIKQSISLFHGYRKTKPKDLEPVYPKEWKIEHTMLQLFQKITALLKIYMEKCVYRTWMPPLLPPPFQVK